VIKGSIEERVIESQERKRSLAASAFGSKKEKKKVKEARLADLKVYTCC
jgi:SNF2 family DNA or RNA helicase